MTLDLETRVRSAFAEQFGGLPDFVARAPGRVNLIGEHTDYNDGFVLPMAIGRHAIAAMRARDDGEMRVYAADLGRSSAFTLDSSLAACPVEGWSNYVRGVAAALTGQGLLLRGAEIVVAGDVPQGAGLSSSAALEVAAGLAFAALAGASDHDRTALALAGQRAEHDFAGCRCGIMDQLVSARAISGSALLIDCRSLSARPVLLPVDAAVMIVHSGVSRGLVDGEYNLRREQCEAAARHYGVRALRDLGVEELESGKRGLDPVALRRARHVVGENARTLAAADALASGDLATLGGLLRASHSSLRDDFAVSTPKVDSLVETLQEAVGNAGGARMTGGGFGGAVVAVAPADVIGRASEMVLERYRTPAGSPPLVMIERPAGGCELLLGP